MKLKIVNFILKIKPELFQKERRAISRQIGAHTDCNHSSKKEKKKKTLDEQYNKCVYKNESMRDRKFQVLTFQL